MTMVTTSWYSSSSSSSGRSTCALRPGYTCTSTWKQEPSAAVSAAACQRMCEALSDTDGEGCEYDSKTSTCGVTVKCRLTRAVNAREMHAAVCHPPSSSSSSSGAAGISEEGLVYVHLDADVVHMVQ